jgi:hypothetical protein
MMKRFMPLIVVVLILVLGLITFCVANIGEKTVLTDNGAESPSASPTSSDTPSPSPEDPSEEPSVSEESESPYSGPLNPLTGMPVSEDITSQRPYAIMINNISVAQPQLGVSKADIIYEVPVEGGITRMMAVFQDVTGVGAIGSIRSARPYFVELALGLDAIYIHAGGSSDAYASLKSSGISHLDGVNGSKQDIFYRDKQRRQTMGYEHSLTTSGELIDEFLPTYGIGLDHKDGFENKMTFADEAVPAGGEAANSIKVHFNGSKSTSFDATDGQYYLSQYGDSYTDGDDGTQLAVSNMLVLYTGIANIPGDSAGRLTVDLTGSGTGQFFCGGKYIDISWSKKSTSSQLVFTKEDGTELVFAPGKTYICIVNHGATVDIS